MDDDHFVQQKQNSEPSAYPFPAFLAIAIFTLFLIVCLVFIHNSTPKHITPNAAAPITPQAPVLLPPPPVVPIDADPGNVAAWVKLAYKYGKDSDDKYAKYGPGTEYQEDLAQAAYWLRKAADQGNAQAQSDLGDLYNRGDGVPQDYSQAFLWTQKAVAQGNMDAENNLGLMYKKGQGVTQDYVHAALLLRMAADQGDAVAQSNLGFLYFHGWGVTLDYSQALLLWQKAANQDQPEAEDGLAYLYGHGLGTPVDAVKADFWHLKANDYYGNDRKANYVDCEHEACTQQLQ